MKKIFTIFGAIYLTSLILTSCGTNYLVGPDFKKPSDVYGTYCDNSCDFYISLANLPDIKSDLTGLSNKAVDEILNSKSDGYAFINKGGGVTGVGYRNVVSIGEVKQKNNYPVYCKGEKFKGAEIRITWINSGLEIYPDGVYQIRNCPNGIDWNSEQNSEKFKVSLAVPDGSIKFLKN